MEAVRQEFERYEKRAQQAAEQIKALTERVDRLEREEGAGGGSVDPYNRQLLEKLKGLREVAAEDKRVFEQVVQERDEAVKERDRLREEKKKLEYRILILVRSLEEAEAKGN